MKPKGVVDKQTCGRKTCLRLKNNYSTRKQENKLIVPKPTDGDLALLS